jgi:hypothetical protein
MKLDLSALDGAITFNHPSERVSQNERLVASLRKEAKRLVKRRMEGLALYCPLPAAIPFHASQAKWRVIDGSNRAGKTLVGAVCSSRAWLGCDPYDKFVKTNGRGLVIGLDGDHLAQMWAKCSLEGAFKIIKDEHTGLWRAVRPDPNNHRVLDPYDAAYKEKWKDAPPLIPPRMILGRIAWEDRAKGIPRLVRFKNGWTVLFRSSEGKSPRGEHYHMGWIDEQISNENFYVELVRGLVQLGESDKHRPRGIWSATPQDCNLQLYELRERANTGQGDVEAFQLHIDDNPFIPDEEKLEFYNSIPEEERQVRYHGQYAVVLKRVYGEFSATEGGPHGCEPFSIPPDWTRYVGIDPGRRHMGSVFLAVDPEERHVWVYDGFDLLARDADSWAAEIAARQGEQRFEAMVIDQQMGRQHPPGAGLNVAEQFWEALKKVNALPRREGPLAGFYPGSNDIDAREKSLLSWMSIRAYGPFSGTAKLRVMRGMCPKLEKQILRARIDPKTGKRAKTEEDILVGLEYLAAFDPRYYAPEGVKDEQVYDVWHAYQEKLKRKPRGVSARTLSTGIEIG